MKVLIVDDDHDSADVLGTLLTALGHETKEVFSLDEGLKQFVIYEPNLVFMDIFFGNSNRTGLDYIVDMKQINKNIPVVIVTGYKEAEKVLDAFRKGAYDCLLKPYNFDYIRNLITHVNVK